MCRILVVGDAMLDKYYFGEVTRISPEAPVPINRVTKIKETLGGAANVTHNLSLLGCHTSLIAQIGTENHGDNLIDKLISRGIDILGIMRTNAKPTTTKIRIIGGNQQMLRLDFEDTAKISDDDAEKLLMNISAQIKNVDAVIISDYGKGICTEKICQTVIKKCREQNKIVTVDPKGDDWEKYRGANFITPNLKELNDILPKKISNDDSEIEIAARGVIEKFNLSGLIVTRSAKGLSVIDGEKISHIAAKTQEVFDVSGAGDTVISVFTLGIAGKLEAAQAAYLANVAAGVVVSKVGTYAVSREELLTALN
ncbi:MAG: D-glycero-beta-D-manno-heptose-7-phosphate kinase [Selenomonadaceae bacterium]|nr:D-glycero-beta-D-manno-heptose-7-phosphate kinase [Selenomonadaceae bacterium]